MMRWRHLHLGVGAAGLVLFILTGQYMARVAGVPDLPDTDRMLYRSVHIYLLLASVANVCAGYFMSAGAVSNHLQRLCCLLLLLAPVLLATSFFTELSAGSLERPLAKAGLYMIFFAATVLCLHAAWRDFRKSSPQ